MRDSMVIYRSFFEAINELNKEQQAEVWNAIFEYGLNQNDIELCGLSKTIFTLIKPIIESNLKKYINGCKPKTKQKVSKEEAKNKQNISKSEANVNDNVNENDNVNIVERKQSFLNSLKPYLVVYGKDMMNDFYLFWSETTLNNKKLKFELQKTFSIEHRLRTWKKNSIKFGNEYSVDNKPKFNPYG